MTKARVAARSKSRRWTERSLLLGGVLAVCMWVWSAASNAVFQDWESWVFDREVCGEQSTIAEYLAEKTGRIAREVCVRLGFTPAPERVTCLHIRPHSGGPAFPDTGGWVGRLASPRLHLSAMVRGGADDRTLGLSLGPIPGTALPGHKGNVGVAGRREDRAPPPHRRDNRKQS